jgi:hypothetical protein
MEQNLEAGYFDHTLRVPLYRVNQQLPSEQQTKYFHMEKHLRESRRVDLGIG